MLDTALGRSAAPLDELRPFALDVAPLPRLDGMVARRAQQRSAQRSAVGSSTAWSSECGSADASSSSHFGVPSTADADAEAAGIYAAAYGKDPSFYDFYRAMQSYEHTFGADGSNPTGQSSIILSPSNDYLREFRGGNR